MLFYVLLGSYFGSVGIEKGGDPKDFFRVRSLFLL